MKKTTGKNTAYLFTPILILTLFTAMFLLAPPQSRAQTGEMNGPGWFMESATPVSPEEAAAYFASLQARANLQPGHVFASSSAAAASPEITELARALQNDPKLIYDYVHNYIEYVPYYGSTKGATLTLLDGSGNDFDQASLLIALLRASGNNTARYLFGKMTIPVTQMANWFGVDVMAITQIIENNGIPLPTDGTFKIDRVWVRATIGGADYVFDPAFKNYTDTPKTIFPDAMGYSQTDFLNAARADARIDPNFVQNLHEGNIRSKLTGYANTLVASMRNQHANKSVAEIIGGHSIVQTNLAQYATTLPFSPAIATCPTPTDPAALCIWDDIPDIYTTTIQIQHAGIDFKIKTPDLSGKRLTLTYAGADNHPELRLGAFLLMPGFATTLGNKNTCTITIDHPYPAKSGKYMDQQAPLQLVSGATYAIVYNFGGISDTLLANRQKQLESYKAQGLVDSSEAVLGETLNIMGMTWLKEAMLSYKLIAALTETIPVMHHAVGVMAQESGYYINMPAVGMITTSKHNYTASRTVAYKIITLVMSALEHGVLEQLMGSSKPGVSTMKLLQLANSRGQRIFMADKNNYAGTIRPLLETVESTQRYSIADLDNFTTDVDNGRVLILPEHGQITLNQWKGKGYISKYFPSDTAPQNMSMVIDSGYFGGYITSPETVLPPVVNQITKVTQDSIPTAATVSLNISTVPILTSNEPVDMAGGAYLYDHTDLAMGGGAPLGLTFARSYTSANAMTSRNMGYGWSHNHDIRLIPTSHGEPGLGLRQPLDVAAVVTAMYVTLDILLSFDDPTAWVSASLVSKWAVDQLIDNAMVAQIGNKSMEFVKLADGSFAAPPGITTQLVKNGDGTFSLLERFGTRIDFNANKQAAKLTDVDGNVLTYTYNGTTLDNVRDAFGRTLTLGYDTASRINKVTDSTGRFVAYGYDAGDQTSYTDPEGKVWTYGFYPGHLFFLIWDPVLNTLIWNNYDSLDRVSSQDVERIDASGHEYNALYNFYFSGYRNIEEDPAGNQTVYFYDRKGRPVAVQDALGKKTQKEYDGQDHVVATVDPRGDRTTYEYDGNQNLRFVTNAKLEKTENIYDAQFRLTDTYDPLRNRVHYEYDSEHHPRFTTVYPATGKQITTERTYTTKGFPQNVINPMGTVTTMTYDVYGNPDTVKTGTHPLVDYTYDPVGRMTDVWDQVKAHTSFLYDKRDLVTTKIDPLLRNTTYQYYDDGHLWKKTDRKGDIITYTYTPSGKVRIIGYPNATAVTFVYNNLDQIESMTDQIGTTRYEYDKVGRVAKVTDPNGFIMQYQYDEAGNLTQITYPGSKTVTYRYDALNRLQYVDNWLGQTATYEYDGGGRMVKLTNFNGSTVEYGYDNANRLTRLANMNGTAPIATYSFPTLDANGNPQQVDATEPLPPNPNVVTTAFTYNSTRNRLDSDGAQTYGYDNEGQQTTHGTGAYTYDYEHRLTSVNDGSRLFLASYDSTGNRLKVVRGTATTYYIYDQLGNLLAEADGNKTITRYYLHGLGLLAMATPANAIYCYHYNQVGNTVAMTDSGKTVVNTYAYLPFGMLANKNETIAAGQPFTFSGQHGVMAEGFDLYYMRARYYDAKIRRFLSEDPAGFGGGDLNLYAYVGGNPITRVDPSGLWAAGVSVEVSTINPITSGGGGVYGVNLEYTSSSGWNVYHYSTPNDVNSVGFLPGLSVQGNIATGTGDWTGPFESGSGSYGIATGGYFQTPADQSEPGYFGIQGGLALGPPGIGFTRTEYRKSFPGSSCP